MAITGSLHPLSKEVAEQLRSQMRRMLVRLEELRSMAEEVLAFHIEGMAEDGDEIPAPTSFDAISLTEDFRDAVAVLAIKAPDSANPAVRINITIPDQMLKRIDSYASQHGLTRSGFLVNAAKKEIDLQSRR